MDMLAVLAYLLSVWHFTAGEAHNLYLVASTVIVLIGRAERRSNP